MKKNIGSADKTIRLILVVICAILFFTKTITGVAGIVLLALGAIFLITSFIDFCPIWAAIGINTNK